MSLISEATAFAYRFAPWLPEREVTARLFTGQRLRVVVPEVVGLELYRRGRIEPEVTRFLIDNLRPGDVFVDVGAQYGYFSLLASTLVGPGGTVIAFEPGSGTCELLRRNTAQFANVLVEHAAVAASDGVVELKDFGARRSSLNTLSSRARVPAAEQALLRSTRGSVPAVALDSYCSRGRALPSLLKIDAEGFELQILKGMQRVLAEASPLIALEVGDYESGAASLSVACIDHLEHAGYACYEFDGDDFVPHRRQPTYGYGNLFFRR